MKSFNPFINAILFIALFAAFTSCQKENLEENAPISIEQTSQEAAPQDKGDQSGATTEALTDRTQATSRGGCDNRAWFYRPFHKKNYHVGTDLYVKVGVANKHDIAYMELYVNDEYVRTERKYPFEWGKPHADNDHYLNDMQRGTYELKVKVVDNCHRYYYKYITIYVGNHYNHCNYNSWFKTPKQGSYHPKNTDLYVKVDVENKHDIDYVELYVNDEYVRTERNYPYEWGRPHAHNDHALNHMRQGTYELKAKIVDTCGNSWYRWSTIYVN